jgi:O-antigen/teichoic acid export membrane protein
MVVESNQASPTTTHSAERFRRARLAMLMGLVERVSFAGAGIVRLALLVWGLTQAEYGLYVATLQFVATANLLDFGLHYGTAVSVAEAKGKDDHAAAREIVSTAAVIYSLISSAALITIIPTVILLPMSWLFHVDAELAGLARLLVVIGVIDVVLCMPFKVVEGGLVGQQRRYTVSTYRSLTTLINVLTILVVLLFPTRKLLHLAIATTALDLLSSASFLVWTLVRWPSEVAISLGAVRWSRARSLTASGATFFFSNLGNVLRRSIGALVLIHARGPQAVPTFSVSFQLFVIGLSFTDVVGESFWPAYGEAAARQDWAWVKSAYQTGARMSICAGGLLASLGVLFGADLIHVWTPKVALPSQTLLLTLAAWLMLQTLLNSAASILIGVKRNDIVMWTVLAEGLVSFTGSNLVAPRWGAEGIGIVLMLSSLCSAWFLTGFAVPWRTAQRVRLSATIPLRIGVALAVTLLLGLGARQVLLPLKPLLRLAVGAPFGALVYGTLAWLVVMSDEDRSRLRSLLRRRSRAV